TQGGGVGLSLLEGLRFTRGNSPIHEIDPRIKFLFTMVIFVSAILFTQLLPLLFILLIQVPLVYIAKIQKEWTQSLRGGLFLAAIILVTNLISLYFFSSRTLTTENLEYALAITIRFLVLITSFSLFFLTTSPDKLSLALEKARIPFEFNFAFITAIRFVPVLADEAQSIIDAQRSRGLELDKGGFFMRIRKYIPILLPLIINSIRRSLERTNLYELKIRGNDYVVLVMVLLALALVLYVRYVFPPFGQLLPPGTLI
ncbi:MAG: energy-coupling factor transporter transmembrane component T family protein, partial [Candidatus Thorarchaeota archaeon]